MIVLSATTDAVQVVLGGAVATSQLPCVSSWRDITATTYTAGRTAANTNNTTDVDVVPAPAASTQRVVDFLSVRNADTSAAVVTIKLDLAGTEFVLWSGTLQVGWSVTYTDALGWQVRNAAGIAITAPMLNSAASSVMCPPHFATANLTSTKTITSGITFAVYMGKAPRALTSVQLRCRVTTAMATITWGEVAVAKGAIVVGGNPSLTVVGWDDVAAVFNSTGQKTRTINVSSGQAINEGDDLWALIGNQATTACVMRAQSIADDLQVGVQASLATRPSLNVGNAQTYTIEGATTVAAWCAFIV